MNYTPEQSRRLRIDAIRASYDRDPRIRCIRHQMEAALKHGDDLMAYHRLPTAELVAYVKGIGEAYR